MCSTTSWQFWHKWHVTRRIPHNCVFPSRRNKILYLSVYRMVMSMFRLSPWIFLLLPSCYGDMKASWKVLSQLEQCCDWAPSRKRAHYTEYTLALWKCAVFSLLLKLYVLRWGWRPGSRVLRGDSGDEERTQESQAEKDPQEPHTSGVCVCWSVFFHSHFLSLFFWLVFFCLCSFPFFEVQLINSPSSASFLFSVIM